jgi:hypothetical protein
MVRHVRVHTILPDGLTRAAAAVLEAAGAAHVVGNPMAAAEAAATDPGALALIGPNRSADVTEAVEVTAPAGLALLAPGQQLDGQLRLAGLRRADDPGVAELLVLAGLANAPEIERAAASALPIVAFDAAQGAPLGDRELRVALPNAPVDGAMSVPELLAGVERAQAVAELVVRGLREGAADRAEMVADLRRLGDFDEHGDPPDPPVWLWRANQAWELEPDRPL